LATPLSPNAFCDWESPEIRSEMFKIKVPKLVIWEENEITLPLFRSYDSEMLWNIVERELADPQRK
jgi:hypothetical protein